MPTIDIAQLPVDHATQTRVKINQKHVKYLAGLIKDGIKLDPIVLFYDGVKNHFGGGFHRVAAAILAGETIIEYKVIPGTQLDALAYALSDNIRHGLPLTPQDRRKAVSMALAAFPDRSNRAIADMCGVPEHSVRLAAESAPKGGSKETMQVRPEAHLTDKVDANPGVKYRKGKDGKLYPATNRAKGTRRKRAAEPVDTSGHIDPALSVTATVEQPAPGPNAPTPPPPPPQPPTIKDGIGRVIPLRLRPIWYRGQEPLRVAKEVQKLETFFKDAKESPDKFWESANPASMWANLKLMRQALQHAALFTICPTCNGMEGDNCAFCHGAGMINEFTWNVTVPEETKALVLKLAVAPQSA